MSGCSSNTDQVDSKQDNEYEGYSRSLTIPNPTCLT